MSSTDYKRPSFTLVRFLIALILMGLAFVMFFAAVPAFAQENKSFKAVTGQMDIDFGTRKNLDGEGKPAKGAKDTYAFSLIVAETTTFSGKIFREPIVVQGKWFQKNKASKYQYDVSLGVISARDPNAKKVVGKWVGAMPVSEAGIYELDKGVEGSFLRVQIDAIGKADAFDEKFSGRMFGKGTAKSNQAVEFIRQVGGRQVKIVSKNTDPLRYENVKLAAGPAAVYTSAIVNGELVYDYETGNYLIGNLVFKSGEKTDKVTGSIKWVQDPGYDTNGKSWFDFNVRFNEDQKPSTEEDAFAQLNDEDAFFAVDTSGSTLTGTVNFEDTFLGSGENRTVGSSKIVYNLNGNNVTKLQVVNFIKLWLLSIGPVCDE